MSHQAALQDVPVAAIKPSPYQYRTRFDDQKQRQLVESLRANGLSTPILVRAHVDGFELVSGERRWRAAQELGWKNIRGICEEMTDADAAARVVTENEIRSDANIMEKAAGYKRLMRPPCSLTLEDIAKRFGLSAASSVKRIVDLLDQPPLIQNFLSQDKLGEAHVRFLTKIKDLKSRLMLAKQAADEGWTVKMTEAQVAKVLGKTDRAPPKSASKKGASYENIYNSFHCAVFGDEIEIGGRRFKRNGDLPEQFVQDFRIALQCMLRDIELGLNQPAATTPDVLSAPAEATLPAMAAVPPQQPPAEPSPSALPVAQPQLPPTITPQLASTEIAAEFLKGAAEEMESAKRTLRDILSGLTKKPTPTEDDKSSDDPTPK